MNSSLILRRGRRHAPEKVCQWMFALRREFARFRVFAATRSTASRSFRQQAFSRISQNQFRTRRISSMLRRPARRAFVAQRVTSLGELLLIGVPRFALGTFDAHILPSRTQFTPVPHVCVLTEKTVLSSVQPGEPPDVMLLAKEERGRRGPA